MRKKVLRILLLAAVLLLLSACAKEKQEEEYPGLSHLVELTNGLATEYNAVAETAINNGWEYDDETVAEMDRIADLIDTINEGIVSPETFAEGQIAELTAGAKECTKEIAAIRKKVAEEYTVPEEETTAE